MKNKYTVFEIANWFLSKEEMSHKKLQKLCYYAKSWHLVLFKKENLISEDFQAWVHGPVSPILYQKYKSYGWNPICKTKSIANIDPVVNDFLEQVWETYGDLDGHQLESLTHKESPWISARVGLGTWDSSTNIILEENMYSFYKSIYQGE